MTDKKLRFKVLDTAIKRSLDKIDQQRESAKAKTDDTWISEMKTITGKVSERFQKLSQKDITAYAKGELADELESHYSDLPDVQRKVKKANAVKIVICSNAFEQVLDKVQDKIAKAKAAATKAKKPVPSFNLEQCIMRALTPVRQDLDKKHGVTDAAIVKAVNASLKKRTPKKASVMAANKLAEKLLELPDPEFFGYMALMFKTFRTNDLDLGDAKDNQQLQEMHTQFETWQKAFS